MLKTEEIPWFPPFPAFSALRPGLILETYHIVTPAPGFSELCFRTRYSYKYVHLQGVGPQVQSEIGPSLLFFSLIRPSLPFFLPESRQLAFLSITPSRTYLFAITQTRPKIGKNKAITNWPITPSRYPLRASSRVSTTTLQRSLQ